MTIHYQNTKGQELMISGIIHLQDIEDGKWIAVTTQGKELTLLTDSIEGIYHEDTKTVNISLMRKGSK